MQPCFNVLIISVSHARRKPVSHGGADGRPRRCYPTNGSLAQMLRGLAQTLTKSFGNIIAKKDAEIRELKVRVTSLEEKNRRPDISHEVHS